jgi:PncC family amidohydrolase
VSDSFKKQQKLFYLKSKIFDLLKESNLEISCAESCTGGLISTILTDIPGISKFFWGSIVVYSNEAKQKVLNVDEDTLNRFGAVSEEVLIELCNGVQALSGTDISLAVTGIAGPDGGTKKKPVGTVWIGLLGPKYPTFIRRYSFGGNRDAVRNSASITALLMLESFILGRNILDIETIQEYI